MSLSQWVGRGLLSAAILAGLVAPSSAASVLALDSTSSSPGTVQGDLIWGWEFDVSTPLVVDGLGFFDVGANGLVESHQVWLWDATSEVVLASTTVTSESALVPSADRNGDWRLEHIAPVVLQPGRYVIGAYYSLPGPEGDGAVALANITTIPELTFVTLRIGVDLGFPEPRDLYNPGLFGPTLSVTRASVPEPGTIALLGLVLTLSARRVRGRSGRTAA